MTESGHPVAFSPFSPAGKYDLSRVGSEPVQSIVARPADDADDRIGTSVRGRDDRHRPYGV